MTNEVVFVKPEDDVLEVDCPIKPLGWRVVVRPYRPEKFTEGGIELPEEALDNAQILTFVGQIVDMGNKAFTAVTRAGIDMSEIEPRPKVGDWVLYGSYGGQKIVLKNQTEYRLMNDDAIMAVARDPKEFLIYL